MCEVVCDGVHDRIERQMGTRLSDCDLYTHSHMHTHTQLLLQYIYNACDMYEQLNCPKSYS